MVKDAAAQAVFAPGRHGAVGLGQIAQAREGLGAVAAGVEEVDRLAACDAVARGRYVKAVQDYNVLTRSFPTNITAKLFSYVAKPNFSVADEKAMAAPPQVDFGASAPAARP